MSGQLGIPVGFVGGLLAGAVAMALLVLLWRQLRPALARLRYLLAAALVAAFAIAAGALYLTLGDHSGAGGAASTPVSAPGGAEPPGAVPGAGPNIGAAGATPVSRASADSTLPTSLPAIPTPSAAVPDAASAGELERRVSGHPDDASAWLALAEQRHARHDYAGARVAYAKVAGLQAMTAQSWADYAEVLSSLGGGSLSGEAGAALDNALRLDAWNPEAMWLKASQAHEQHDDAEALVWWRRLRAVLPPDSPDTLIVEAKIAEAESLSRRMPSPPPVQMGR